MPLSHRCLEAEHRLGCQSSSFRAVARLQVFPAALLRPSELLQRGLHAVMAFVSSWHRQRFKQAFKTD